MLAEGLKYKKAMDYNEVFRYVKDGYLPFSGGTDVLIKAKEGFLRAEGLLYIGDMPDLLGIEEKESAIFIGAGVRISDIIEDPLIIGQFPGLVQALSLIGSPQIRNQATLGGNMGNCSPVADSMPMLMALDAKAHIVSENNRRVVEVRDLPKGVCQTALQTGELIEKVEIPKRDDINLQFYRKFGQRKEVCIQKCSTAAVISLDDDTVVRAAIAIGAVAVRALRCDSAEEFLKGKKINEENIRKACELISEEAKPITDIRSTVEYRKKMVGTGFYEKMMELIR
ncbi:MAG: FAD binding domain-containing protein [Candidatus Muiribacteriaceae bacterium]